MVSTDNLVLKNTICAAVTALYQMKATRADPAVIDVLRSPFVTGRGLNACVIIAALRQHQRGLY